MNNLFKYLLYLFLSFSCTSQAQKNDDLIFFESRLQTLTNKILTENSDSLKYEANKFLIEDIEEVILMKGSFDYPFENLDNMSILTSPDEKFRIYNWVVPKEDGSFEYFAYLQLYKKRKKGLYFFKLSDISSMVNDEQYKIFTNGDWFGALYSEIIHNEFESKDIYTLVGWDGNNNTSTKRIVEILQLDENKKPVFGAPIIKMNDGTRYRMILEYSNNVSTTMAYDPNNKHIVYDHLEPIEGAEKDSYEFYIPNLSYDGLTFKNGKWRMIEDVPVFNNKKQDGKQAKNIERGLTEE